MAIEKGKSKQKYGFYLNDETTNMIDTHLESAQTNNRSKFVEKAIHHYSAYLDTGHNKILGNEIIRVMRDIMFIDNRFNGVNILSNNIIGRR